MIRKDRTNNKQYFIRLSIIFFFLAIVTPPVLAEGGTGFNFKPTITSCKSLINTIVYQEVVRNTNLRTTIYTTSADSSKSLSCCCVEETGTDSTLALCKYILEENLLNPIFMIACSIKNSRLLI